MKIPIHIFMLLSVLYIGCGGDAEKKAVFEPPKDKIEKFDFPELYWSEDTFQYYLKKDLENIDSSLLRKYGHLNSGELIGLSRSHLLDVFGLFSFGKDSDIGCKLILMSVLKGDRGEALSFMGNTLVFATYSGQTGYITPFGGKETDIHKGYTYYMKSLQQNYNLTRIALVDHAFSDFYRNHKKDIHASAILGESTARLERIYFVGDSIGSKICAYPLYRLYSEGYIGWEKSNTDYKDVIKASIYFVKAFANKDPDLLFEYGTRLDDKERQYDLLLSSYLKAVEFQNSPIRYQANKFLTKNHPQKWGQYKRENNIVEEI